MKFVLATGLLLLFIPALDQSNSWRGLTPLRSTCEDVKKVLGIENCSPRTNYKIVELEVTIEFATGNCDKAPQSWRVSKDTVFAIILSPRIPMVPSQLGLDLSKYKKRNDGEIVGIEHYTSEKDGVSVDMYAGVIQHVFLYPRKADDALRCSQPQQVANQVDQTKPGAPFTFPKFDDYAGLSFAQEKKRLDCFAEELRRVRGELGYIIEYRRKGQRQPLARAKRAKDYLVKVKNIEAKRISIVDGGYQTEFKIELRLGPVSSK